ncbi:MAG TPA: Flp pilus assembly protein CpaB [Beijerinckiaceae bacterium]|jgi:pilus assembly protein CpaB
MKPARLAVLGIAILAGGGAALMMSGGGEPPPAPQVVEVAAPAKTVDVLVAAADVQMGHGLKAADLRWLAWPADSVPAAVIRKSEFPNAVEETAGSIARTNFFGGEPIRREKLIKADGGGFMSAILPAGMRAVAMSIDTRGASSAGGFILPNDRVDVIRTYRDEESSRSGGVDVIMSETILTNIRVLAIGQNIQDRNGEKVVTGETATLELTPAQAETIALAQKVGQLSLALRSIADANQPQDAPRTDRAENALTVVRYGVPKQSAKR